MISFGAVLAISLLVPPPIHFAATLSVAPATDLQSTMLAAGHAFERYYRLENDGAIDAYVERARHRGIAAERSETCRLPSGASSTRPSVRANPPISASSIRQRGRLVAMSGAYLAVLEAVADRSEADVVSAAIANLIGRVAALQRSADTHGTGDLFIDQAAATLRLAVDRLHGDDAAENRKRDIERVDAIVRRLLTILEDDAIRQRARSVDATQLAYDSWLANVAGGAAKAPTSDVPSCSEPAIFRRDHVKSLDTNGRVSDARGLRLRKRADDTRQADPAAVVRAIRALDERDMTILESTADLTNAGRTASARDSLERAAESFERAVPR